jgi:hypothetical protein
MGHDGTNDAEEVRLFRHRSRLAISARAVHASNKEQPFTR